MRKKIIIGLGVASLSLTAFGGSASASSDPSCFGQVHKTINTVGFGGFSNVGEVVWAVGGQGKHAIARGLCAHG
jgi:hypothetical protein